MILNATLRKLRNRIFGNTNVSGVADCSCKFVDNVLQLGILNQYKLMKCLIPPSDMPNLADVGFHAYSQFEEDGLLLYIFAIIGTTNKRVVEICAGDGIQCMAANLIINHGWDGLLFDGDLKNIERGRSFYSKNFLTWINPPKLCHSWITVDNVNEFIKENGFQGEIDLLSTDLDGNDYWISKAITSIRPRVVICETHNVIPADRSITIPYDHEFYIGKNGMHRDFTSASLLAFSKLYKEKGYRLIGGHRHGFNAIFMRNDVGIEYFPEVSVTSVHDNSCSRNVQQKIWPEIKKMPWQEV